jgi:hypothetical protein
MPGFLDFKVPCNSYKTEQVRREARWGGRSSEYQEALAQTLARGRPDFYINFHFNDSVSQSWALRCLKMAWAMFERQHLGRNYHQRRDRCTGPIILENLTSNTHANVLVTLPPDMRELTTKEIEDELFPIWKRLVAKGGVYVAKTWRDPGQHPWEGRLERYVVKQMHPCETAERLFWLQDFWPAHLSYEKYDKIKAKKEKKEREKAEKKAKSCKTVKSRQC